MKNEGNWLDKYDALKQWTFESVHFINCAKVDGWDILNGYRYSVKFIK